MQSANGEVPITLQFSLTDQMWFGRDVLEGFPGSYLHDLHLGMHEGVSLPKACPCAGMPWRMGLEPKPVVSHVVQMYPRQVSG